MSDSAIAWKATYDDGRTRSSAAYPRWREVPLDGVVAFEVTVDGERVIETSIPDGCTGRNLRYRITTDQTREGVILGRCVRVGWTPSGPAFIYDLFTGVRYRKLDGFEGDGDWNEPQPMGDEA